MGQRTPWFTTGGHPVVTDYDLSLPRWKGASIQIAILSDTHAAAPVMSQEVLSRVVDQVNALGADLILCPGDFITAFLPPNRPLPPAEAVAPFTALRARLGVYFSLGNHDWSDDPLYRKERPHTSMADAIRDAGLTLLRNEGRLIEGPPRFWLAGLDSWFGGRTHSRAERHDDLDAALDGAPPDCPVLVMAHEPDAFPQIADRTDLVVSGHTHGGQADLWGWRPLTPSRYGGHYARGVFRQDGSVLVVSAGVGYSGIPLRFRCPSEIVRLTLHGEESVS